MQDNVIGGGFLLFPEFNRQSSGLCVLRHRGSAAASPFESQLMHQQQRQILRRQTRNLSTPAPVCNPHHHAVIDNGPTAAAVRGAEYFPVNWLTICHVQTTTIASISSRRLKLESRVPAPAKSAAIAAMWKASGALRSPIMDRSRAQHTMSFVIVRSIELQRFDALGALICVEPAVR
jgi:hypothetical protein